MLSICYLFFFLENIQIDLYYKTVHVHLSDFSSLICRKNNTGVSEGTQNENEMIVVTVFPLGTLLLSFPLKTALLPVQEFVVICQGSTPIILFLATTPTTLRCCILGGLFQALPQRHESLVPLLFSKWILITPKLSGQATLNIHVSTSRVVRGNIGQGKGLWRRVLRKIVLRT